MYLNCQLQESTETEMSSETHAQQGSLSSTDTHIPLSLVLFKKSIVDAPEEIVKMVSKELFETLTLRSLLHLCTACKQTPTALMLAIALQNSVPSLTGLPMDNPDPGFYIDIAKRFFGPVDIPIGRRTDMYDALKPGRFLGALVCRNNIDAPHGCFSSGLAYYVHLVLHSCDLVHTKKGRDFIKGIVLEWLQTPLVGAMVKVYNHLVNVLDHGFVLRKRNLEPGCIGHITYSVEQDEHL